MVNQSAQPSKQFELWQRMYERFQLEPLPAGLVDAPGVSQIIVPMTDADELISSPGARLTVSVAVGAGVAGMTVADTVPTGRRWKLIALQAIRVTGDNTLDGFGIADTSAGVSMRFDIQAAATEIVLFLPQPLTLEETDTWRINTSGAGVGASTFGARAYIVEEDRF